jgi:molybdate transport system ATP-binding protein
VEIDAAATTPESTSALNAIAARVVTVTEVGNRARVGLAIPQPLVAEVTSASVSRLGLRPGIAVTARWKATATRLTAL